MQMDIVFVAIIVFALTIWDSNIIIENRARVERNKIIIWADAIQVKPVW
jgi:hypothetical protein